MCGQKRVSVECGDVRRNPPGLTFLIEKRIVTELFIARTAALHIGETLRFADLSIRRTKQCEKERSGVDLS